MYGVRNIMRPSINQSDHYDSAMSIHYIDTMFFPFQKSSFSVSFTFANSVSYTHHQNVLTLVLTLPTLRVNL